MIHSKLSSRRTFLAVAASAGLALAPVPAFADLTGDRRRYFEGVAQAPTMEAAGAPLAEDDVRTLRSLATDASDAAIGAAEAILERYTLFRVALAADGAAQIADGGAGRVLSEQGWRAFLVRVENAHAKRQTLGVATQHGAPTQMFVQSGAQRPALLDTVATAPLVADMWVAADMAEMPALDGAAVEYRVIRIFSRDRGRRESEFMFALGDADAAGDAASSALFWFPERRFRAAFECAPSRDVTLGVIDADGAGCVASLTITDALGRRPEASALRGEARTKYRPRSAAPSARAGQRSARSGRTRNVAAHRLAFFLLAHHRREGAIAQRVADFGEDFAAFILA